MLVQASSVPAGGMGMRVSRVVVESGTTSARTFEFNSNLSVINEPLLDAERLLAVFRNLYLGIKRGSAIFATIDGVEFEITSDMTPLVGQRLGGQFAIVDLASPPEIKTDPTDIRDVQAVVARAALETVGATCPTLDVARLDQAATAVDRYRDPLANDAHAAYLRRTGLLQLFSRRSGNELLDANDPAVQQLARFDKVLADRRRQVSSSTAPLPSEFAHATQTLRELVTARMGGIPADMAAKMSPEAVQRDVAQWVLQQHDRQITPIVAEICARHAEGIDVLGSVPIVLDLRRVDGLPPGGDAMRWAARLHSESLQFIVLVSNDDSRRWVESTFGMPTTA